jgi:hypothetical protein
MSTSSPGANLAAQGCAGALGQGVQDVGGPLAAGLQHAVHVLPSRVSFGRSAAWCCSLVLVPCLVVLHGKGARNVNPSAC